MVFLEVYTLKKKAEKEYFEYNFAKTEPICSHFAPRLGSHTDRCIGYLDV